MFKTTFSFTKILTKTLPTSNFFLFNKHQTFQPHSRINFVKFPLPKTALPCLRYFSSQDSNKFTKDCCKEDLNAISTKLTVEEQRRFAEACEAYCQAEEDSSLKPTMSTQSVKDFLDFCQKLQQEGQTNRLSNYLEDVANLTESLEDQIRARIQKTEFVLQNGKEDQTAKECLHWLENLSDRSQGAILYSQFLQTLKALLEQDYASAMNSISKCKSCFENSVESDQSIPKLTPAMIHLLKRVIETERSTQRPETSKVQKSDYLQQVETKQQSSEEFGWIVNPTITTGKIPRVSKKDLHLSEIFTKLEKIPESNHKERGSLIHQAIQLLLSSSFIGKNTSSPKEIQDFIQKLPKLSDQNLKAIQNAALFMLILHTKGFALKCLEETMKINNRQKRMDAIFVNQEQNTMLVIDWKTGSSCTKSNLEGLSLYTHHMKEANPNMKIGMFFVFIDFGVVLPGWLSLKKKVHGIKKIAPNFFEFMYYSLTEDLEVDKALFAKRNISNDLEVYKIPEDYPLAKKDNCAKELSKEDLEQALKDSSRTKTS